MATSDRRVRVVVAGLALLLVGAVVAWWLGRPPQMGADDGVFRTVDALYTAVRLKDAGKLAQCEKTLHAHRAAGALPAAAADHLDRLIAEARGGGWAGATEKLYAFMLAQRREGKG